MNSFVFIMALQLIPIKETMIKKMPRISEPERISFQPTFHALIRSLPFKSHVFIRYAFEMIKARLDSGLRFTKSVIDYVIIFVLI